MDEKANQKSLFCESQDHDVYLPQEDDRSCTDRQVEKSNEVKNILNKYSEPSSLDYSPSSSIFESEELDSSTFENDAFERESGVESVDGDWPQSCNTPPLDYDLDLTEEQALETLKYFSKCKFYFSWEGIYFRGICT